MKLNFLLLLPEVCPQRFDLLFRNVVGTPIEREHRSIICREDIGAQAFRIAVIEKRLTKHLNQFPGRSFYLSLVCGTTPPCFEIDLILHLAALS